MKAEDVRERRGEPVIVTYEDGTERLGTIEWGDGRRFAWSVHFEVGGRDVFYNSGNFPKLRSDPGGARPVWSRVTGLDPKPLRPRDG